ncbi:cytokine receptor common subunit beta-like isoform X2 [Engystomops pustulosus]|uniref:cytokine receptor common subunit beta-like isoform X2 n=1 Tax=Engystomops pustulosus TaxID=76066 RepID=UPI003AFB6AFC
MKKRVILCCVTCYLLSAFPGNTGSRLMDSLYCVMEYSEGIINCSWSESPRSRQYVNMTLMDINRGPFCAKDPAKLEPSHETWTCSKVFAGHWLYDSIHLAFVPNRSLESHLNVSNEGDVAKPKNLRCKVSLDQMIHCSWEVRQEVADSVDFSLYYQDQSRKEEVCKSTCWQETPTHLSCACNFTSRPYNSPIHLLNISVGPADPKNSNVLFKICKNIKLLPRNLTINEKSKGETFLISWDKDPIEKPDFKYHYELCYWRDNEVKPTEVTLDCPGHNKTGTPHNGPQELLKLGTHLEPSSSYSVKIRVRLEEDDPSHCYKGPWSEWSAVQTLHTKSVPNTLLLCILVLSAVVVLVIFSFCGFRALVRYKKRWDDGIPNPSKSSIVKSLRKAKNGPGFPHDDHLYVEPFNKITMWTPSKKDPIFFKQEEEEQISRPESEMFQDDDTKCLFLFPMTEDEYPTASITEGYKPFAELIEEQGSKDSEEPQFTVCAFDGPYLFS